MPTQPRSFSDLFDFSNPSIGAYFTQEGLLTASLGEPRFTYNPKRALFQNLFQYTEEFDNAYWSKTNATVTPNQETAPLGGGGDVTMDLVDLDASIDDAYVGVTETTAVGRNYVISGYIKKANTDIVRVGTTPDGECHLEIDFSASSISVISGNNVTAYLSLQRPDGTYRWAATFRSELPTQTLCPLFAPSGEGAVDAYVWGMLLADEDPIKSNALSYPYVKSEATPVNVYERLGIMSEEERTNLCTRSTEFNASAWTKTGVTVTANNSISLDGTSSADEIIENTSSGLHRVRNLATTENNTEYTFSCYVKINTRSQVVLTVADQSDATHNDNIIIDIKNSSIISQTDERSGYEYINRGWYRVWCVFTSGTSGGSYCYVTMRNDNGQAVYAGDGTSSFWLYGAQMEKGSYPTSYIPTQSTSATRISDSITREPKLEYNAQNGTYVIKSQCEESSIISGVGLDGLKLTSNLGPTTISSGTIVYTYDENGGKFFMGKNLIFETAPLAGLPTDLRLGGLTGRTTIDSFDYYPHTFTDTEAIIASQGVYQIDYPFSENQSLNVDSNTGVYSYRSITNAFDTVRSETLTDVFSTTRASTGLVWGVNNTMESVTIDTPRIDHDPNTGDVRGILIEKESTNLIDYSSSLTNWNMVGSSASVGAQNGLIENMEKLIEDTNNGYHQINKAIPGIADDNYTISFTCLPTATRYVAVYLTANGFGSISGAFIIRDDGTTNGTPSSAVSTSVTQLPSGAYRVEIVLRSSGSDIASPVTLWFRMALTDNSVTYVGDGTSFVHIGEIQFERGKKATTYIPTTGSAATRNRDVVSRTPVDEYNASEGTWEIEVEAEGSNAMSNIGIDGLQLTGSGTVVYTYNGTEGKFFANGSLQFTTPPITVPSIVEMGDNGNTSWIKQVQYYPFAMDDVSAGDATSGSFVVDNPIADASVSLDFIDEDFAVKDITNSLNNDRSVSVNDIVSLIDRNSNGIYRDQYGNFREVTDDVLRYNYNELSVKEGALIEHSSTNLLLYSESDGNNWPISDNAADWGTSNLTRRIRTYRYTAGVPASVNTPSTSNFATWSVFFLGNANDPTDNRVIRGEIIGDTTSFGEITFDFGTGSFSLNESTPGISTMRIEDLGSLLYRVSLTICDLSITNVTGLETYVFGSVKQVGGYQLEETTAPTSYIRTGATPVMRNIDTVRLNMDGHLDEDNGTVLVEVPFIPEFIGGVIDGKPVVGKIIPDSADLHNKGVGLEFFGSSGNISVGIARSGVLGVSGSTSLTPGIPYKLAYTYDNTTSTMQLAINGTYVGSFSIDVSDITVSAGSLLPFSGRKISNAGSGNNFLGKACPISRCNYYPRTMTQAELETLTTI